MDNNYQNDQENNIPQQPIEAVQPTVQQPIYNNPVTKAGKSKVGIIIGASLVFVLGVLTFFFLSSGNKDNASESGNGNSAKQRFNGTYIAPTKDDTHKGIVYLDPTNLKKKCTEEDVKRNVNRFGTPTEISKGCMKFYIYDDSGDTYKMILDHNIATNVAWAAEKDVLATGVTKTEYSKDPLAFGPVTANKKLKEITKDWAGNSRLISTTELAKLVDPNNTLEWDPTTYKSTYPKVGFYFDMEYNKARKKYRHSDKSKFAWLYDYTYECTDWGCSVEDNNRYIYDGEKTSNVYGYWTSDATINGNYYEAYEVEWSGSIDIHMIDELTPWNSFGIRPVIEIKKSVIK